MHPSGGKRGCRKSWSGETDKPTQSMLPILHFLQKNSQKNLRKFAINRHVCQQNSRGEAWIGMTIGNNERACTSCALACTEQIAPHVASYIITGRLFNPLNPNVEAHSGRRPVSFIFGKRRERLMIAICPSSLASWAPMQKCGPALNAKCSLFSRFRFN
jgi:hypothetical protein